jgi:hypothetical protein
MCGRNGSELPPLIYLKTDEAKTDEAMECAMKPIVRMLLLSSLFVVGAGPAFAQPGPYWHRHGVRTWHRYGVPGPGGYVLGPAYGRPGEPLGPAYWNGYGPGNPRVCGPGACQDNPLY